MMDKKKEWRLVNADLPPDIWDAPLEVWPVKLRLQVFVRSVELGFPISNELLNYIASGVQRHLNDKDHNPWPETSGGRKKITRMDKGKIEKVALVHYERILRNQFNKSRKMPRSELAELFNVSTATIRDWENTPPPKYQEYYFCDEPDEERELFLYCAEIQKLIKRDGIEAEYSYGRHQIIDERVLVEIVNKERDKSGKEGKN